MRIAISTLAVALVALTGLTAGAARPPPTVRCSAVILRPQTLDGTHRVVLRHVAFWRRRAFQIAAVGGSLPFWSRTLLFIRSSRTSVTIGVPRAWRTRAALAWGGSGVVSTVRFAGCPIPAKLSPDRWNGYVGGFYVREPACVPLRVAVGTRGTTIHLGIGRAC